MQLSKKFLNAVENDKSVTTSELASMTDAGLLARNGTRRAGSWIINVAALARVSEGRELFEKIVSPEKQLTGNNFLFCPAWVKVQA